MPIAVAAFSSDMGKPFSQKIWNIMSTWPSARSRHESAAPDSSANTSKSNPRPFQVMIVKPSAAFWTSVLTTARVSSRDIRGACLPSAVLPCQTMGSSFSLVTIAAQVMPMGRCGRQLKSGPGMSAAVSMSKARYLRVMADLNAGGFNDDTDRDMLPVFCGNWYSRLERHVSARRDSIICAADGITNNVCRPSGAGRHDRLVMELTSMIDTCIGYSCAASRIARAAFFAAIFATAITPAPAGADDAPLTPAEAASRFVIHDDLELDQVLVEPTVRQPLFLNFDERGRLWVVQYIQYPHPAGLKVVSYDKFYRIVYDKVPLPPPKGERGMDKITIHEDTDGD